MLKLEKLIVKAGKKIILNDINYHFKKGKSYLLLGPNGSGKSSLALTVMGYPEYQVIYPGKILFNKANINKIPINKRARLGIFLSYQSPLSLLGITVYDLLRTALEKKQNPIKIHQLINRYSRFLNIDQNLLNRPLNENFSGGEKKKMELLQALVLQPKLLFFDEIDSGVDVDSLKLIALGIRKLQTKNRCLIFISHLSKIIQYLKPDETIILKAGKIAKSGDLNLVKKIEKDGYSGIR